MSFRSKGKDPRIKYVIKYININIINISIVNKYEIIIMRMHSLLNVIYNIHS